MNVSLFTFTNFIFTNSTRTNVTSRSLRNPLNMTAANPAALKAALKNEKAARDFEAMLLTPVLDSLQKTFGGNSEAANIPGASDYRQMATEALGQAIAARGGIGIAQMILRHLQPPEVSGGS
jgi:Rod binding domain-containing protein